MRDQRVEFVIRAKDGQSLSSLCAEFGIAAHRLLWLRRYCEQGVAGIEEHSRRRLAQLDGRSYCPAHRPVAAAAPDWGARSCNGCCRAKASNCPSSPYIACCCGGWCSATGGPRLGTLPAGGSQPTLADGLQESKGGTDAVGPLSVIDDHSRYVIALQRTGTTRTEAVRERLQAAFLDCGVPDACDGHGTPWWNPQAPVAAQLQVWLMKQGIQCLFSGIRHPQTQGKWSAFIWRWRWRGGGGACCKRRWNRRGWMSFAMSTTTSVPTRH